MPPHTEERAPGSHRSASSGASVALVRDCLQHLQGLSPSLRPPRGRCGETGRIWSQDYTRHEAAPRSVGEDTAAGMAGRPGFYPMAGSTRESERRPRAPCGSRHAPMRLGKPVMDVTPDALQLPGSQLRSGCISFLGLPQGGIEAEGITLPRRRTADI